MRRRVIELYEGRVVRDEVSGGYTEESTTEFGMRMRAEMGVGPEGGTNGHDTHETPLLMSKLFFFIQEAFRALRRNAAPSTAAIVTTGVTVILLGVLIPIFQTDAGEERRGPRAAQLPGRALRRRDRGPKSPRCGSELTRSRTSASVEFVSKAAGARGTEGRPRQGEGPGTDLAAQRKPAAGQLPGHPRRRRQPRRDPRGDHPNVAERASAQHDLPDRRKNLRPHQRQPEDRAGHRGAEDRPHRDHRCCCSSLR